MINLRQSVRYTYKKAYKSLKVYDIAGSTVHRVNKI